MTVSGSTYKNTYTLDSSTTVFPYTFKIIASGDILVERYDTVNDTTTTVSSDDYTVVGAGEDEGTRTVTYAGAASYGTAYELILSSDAAYTQPTDYINGDDFAPETHELSLDRLCIEIKQLKEQVDRALKVAKNLTNPTDFSQVTAGYVYTDGTLWSTQDVTVTETEYAATISRGAAADLPAAPAAGDIYVATDTGIMYVCYTASVWETAATTLKLHTGGTYLFQNSSGTTIATLDNSGNLKIAGNLTTQGSF